MAEQPDRSGGVTVRSGIVLTQQRGNRCGARTSRAKREIIRGRAGERWSAQPALDPPAFSGKGGRSAMDRTHTPWSLLPKRVVSRIRVTPSGCWQWLGKPDTTGYGRSTFNGIRIGAHRAVYQWLVGPIPGALQLDHLCHGSDLTCPGGSACLHRRCVNPAHLEPVTRRVNILRGRSKIAAQAARTHCTEGHPYDSANTKYGRRGERICISCSQVRWSHQARKLKKRGLPADDRRHGTTNAYTNHGCRCSACCKANTDYYRDLRRRRSAPHTSAAS